jgi:serine/threonine-protein kinase
MTGQLDRRELERFRQRGGGDPLIGAVINSRYELEGRIGRGGMAIVYLATDRQNGLKVALKIMAGEPDRKRELTERFFREVKAAASINHPNVVEIFDMGTFGNDKLFYVMEYLDGADLSKALGRKGGMDAGRVRAILMQVCEALEAAHSYKDRETGERQPIIHRDMKPENIFLIRKDGKELVKVLDFGLAKVTGKDEKLTRDRDVLGTPTYIAPEQAWSGNCDHRADIYALGVIGYEMLCGMAPFRSADPEERAKILQILLQHRETLPARPSLERPDLDIPGDLEDVVMRALEKDPKKRFQSAREMGEALAGCGSDEEGELPPVTQPASENAARPPKTVEEILGAPPIEEGRGRAARFFRAMLVAGAIGGAALLAYHYRDRIREFIEDVRGAFSETEKPSPVRNPQPPHQPAASTAYEITLESDPQGAMVYDICSGEKTRRLLGSTPLRIALPGGQHSLVLVKRGFQQKEVVVSSEQPGHRLSLTPLRRRPQQQMLAPRQPDGGEAPARGSAVDGGSGGSREEAQEAAPDEDTAPQPETEGSE